jgi:DUF1680 family protein
LLLKSSSRSKNSDYGQVAVQRSPLVYCLEQLDQPEGVLLYRVSLDLRQNASLQFQEELQSDLRGGIVMLKHLEVANEKSTSGSRRYYPYKSHPPQVRQAELRFIPYYACANRAPTQMQVWTPILRGLVSITARIDCAPATSLLHQA